MSIVSLSSAGLAPPPLQSRESSPPDSSGSVTRPVSALIPGVAVQEHKEASDQADPKALRDRVDSLNAAMKQRSSNIEFSIDDDSGRTIVKVVETDTQAVLMQYPSKELLAISKEIDQFQGLFVKTKA